MDRFANNKNRRMFYPWAMFLLAAGFMLMTVYVPGKALPFDNESVTDFGEGWTLLSEDGEPSSKVLELPAKIKTESALRLTKTIPEDMPVPAVLGFRTVHQKVRLYCDGELLYSFGYDEPPMFGKSPGNAWNIVRLSQGCGGKELRLELDSPYAFYQGKIEEIRVGSKAALMFSILREYALSLVVTLIILVSGLFSLIVYALVLRKDAAVGKEMLYLGLFSVFVSFWLFGEGRLTQLFSIPPAVNTNFTFVAMLAVPLPLLLYIACGCRSFGKRVLRILYRALSLLFVGSVLLQALDIYDFIEQLPVIHLSFLVCGAVLLYALIVDIGKNPSSEQCRMLISLGVLVLFFGMETAKIYVNLKSIGGIMRIGVLVFIMIQAYSAIKNASKVLRMSRLASVDALTGCLNRTAYHQCLEELEGQPFIGVVIADINDLKLINDTYGHDIGDEAIVRCADCFSKTFLPYGRCFRIGGDEFAMLGKNLTVQKLSELQSVFEKQTHTGNEQTVYPFSVSSGSAVFDAQTDPSLTDTVRRADKRMYCHKREYKKQD